MSILRKYPRLGMEALYLGLMYVALCWGYRGDIFCFENGQNYWLAVLRMLLVVASKDALAALIALTCFRLGAKGLAGSFVAAVLMGLAMACFPFVSWTHTSFATAPRYDVSCFVTEGYGMVFPIFAAPPFALATFLREWATTRLRRQAA